MARPPARNVPSSASVWHVQPPVARKMYSPRFTPSASADKAWTAKKRGRMRARNPLLCFISACGRVYDTPCMPLQPPGIAR